MEILKLCLGVYGFVRLALLAISIMCLQGRHVGEHCGFLHVYIVASFVSEFVPNMIVSVLSREWNRSASILLGIFMATWGCILTGNLFDSLSHTLLWKTCVATVCVHCVDIMRDMLQLSGVLKPKK